MKKYFKYILCSILLCFPYFVLGKVTCAVDNYSALIDLDKNELGINDTASIKITSDYDYKVSYEIEDKSIIKIDESGIITPQKVGSTKINVLINFQNEENKVECNSVLNIKVMSNDSSLKVLNIEEMDISNIFKSDIYEYEIRLPYNIEKINIIAEANDKNATITGDGRRYINEGNNEYEIIVKATDGSSSTYKIKILREEANSDATLKNLLVEGYVLTPEFKNDVYEYSLSVSEEVDDITISADATYELAKILGTGKYQLATGENEFKIKVVAENNTEQIYTITVNKNNGNSKLENLVIEGYKLDREFKSDLYIYGLTINSDIDKLVINAKAKDNDQIEIIGNEDLKVGENNIIIRVSNKDKGATTYKLLVNKLSEDEQKQIEKNDMLLKILLIVFIISIIFMATVIGIFIYKNNKRNEKKNIIKNKKKKNK